MYSACWTVPSSVICLFDRRWLEASTGQLILFVHVWSQNLAPCALFKEPTQKIKTFCTLPILQFLEFKRRSHNMQSSPTAKLAFLERQAPGCWKMGLVSMLLHLNGCRVGFKVFRASSCLFCLPYRVFSFIPLGYSI